MPIPQEIIDEVRARVSIAEVVGRYVQLQRSGTSMKGRCPFHDEKTPSFHVNEARGTWHCFGACNEGGNVFTFLMKKENRIFPEVVEDLAATVGVEIPKTPMTPQQAQARSETEEMVLANERAQGFFVNALQAQNPLAKQAREYLVKRRMTPELIDEFGIGFCGPGWDALSRWWVAQKVPPAIGEKAGLFSKRRSGDGHYDRFHERITFPVTNPRGRVIGFGGRAIDGAPTMGDESPKYLNSSESPVYKKSEALYGLDAARSAIGKTGRVIIVEGYFDVLGMAAVGIREVVATCGTALTPQHLVAIKRYDPRAVILLYDGDNAGRQAARRSLPLFLESGLPARYQGLPDGQDPDDWAAEIGHDAAVASLDRAIPLVDFYLQFLHGEVAGKSESERLDYLRRVAPIFYKVDPLVLGEYGGKLAEILSLDPPRVIEMIATKGASTAATPAKPVATGGDFRRDGRPDFRRAGGAPFRPRPRWDKDGKRLPEEPPGADLPVSNRLAAVSAKERNSEEAMLRLMLGSRRVADRVRADRITDLFRDPGLRSLGEKIAEAVARTPVRSSDEQNDAPDVSAVLDRAREQLSSGEIRLITGYSVDPRPMEPESLWAEFEGSLAKLERRALSDRRKTLKFEIEAAQRSKDEARLSSLLTESVEIDRKLQRIKK